MKKVIIVGIVLSLIGFGAYSVYQYQSSEQESHGFFVCNEAKTKCLLSQHIHARLSLSVCGIPTNLPKEQGRLDHQHTHKEANLMHWHAQVSADPITQQAIEPNYLSVAEFFTEIGYKFPSSCPGNSQPQIHYSQLTWQDNDNIIVEYK